MKISVLVPIFGVENYIERCANSLFGQTYHNIEYIFVNDCTKDRSIEILSKVIKKYNYRKNDIKIIDHNENRGLSAARNTALEYATGDYIMHVDSDDYIELNTIEKCVNEIHKTNADVVLFGFKNIFRNSELIEYQSISCSREKYICSLLERERPACIWGAMYSRALYLNNNIRAIEGVNMGEDYVTKPKLLYYATNIVAIDESLYNYNRTNELSYTRTFNPRTIIDLTTVMSNLMCFFKGKSDYLLYQESIVKACLLTKIILLKYWSQSIAEIDDFNKINSLFNQEVYIKNLSFNHRIILYLANKRLINLLKKYICWGTFLKRCTNIFRYNKYKNSK